MKYFAWALSKFFSCNKSCPACNETATFEIKRKWMVTALFECSKCGLCYRVPKDSLDAEKKFYGSDYEEGITTSPPAENVLQKLLTTGFKNHEKSYDVCIDVLNAAGLDAGAVVLEFGASWGYGSWQMKKAGFDVIAHEINRSRARFASKNLGVRIIDDPANPPKPVDCFFSKDVIEHISDPHLIWKCAKSALKPGGLFVALTVNGDPALVDRLGSKRYHAMWGKAHPLYITSKYLMSMSSKYGFESKIYTSPFPFDEIRLQKSGSNLTGLEICVIARQPFETRREK